MDVSGWCADRSLDLPSCLRLQTFDSPFHERGALLRGHNEGDGKGDPREQTPERPADWLNRLLPVGHVEALQSSLAELDLQ